MIKEIIFEACSSEFSTENIRQHAKQLIKEEIILKYIKKKKK
jgi:hypothetical protein